MQKTAEIIFKNPAEEHRPFSPASTGYIKKPVPKPVLKKIKPSEKSFKKPSVFKKRPEPPKPPERPKPDPQKSKERVIDNLRQKLKEDKYTLERERDEASEKADAQKPDSAAAKSFLRKKDQTNRKLKIVDRKLINIEKRRSSVSDLLRNIAQIYQNEPNMISFSDYIRLKFGKYVWEKIKDHPELKTLKYISPFTGKKLHVSP